jgi:Tfp pilus assembly protein PilZ
VDSPTKILVIDPDARACRALREALEAAGFETVGAHSEGRARALLGESPRPAALVVGASDAFWRDGMVSDFRATERDLVIVSLLLPGDEYEALLEMGASACAPVAGVETALPALLRRLVAARRARVVTPAPAPGGPRSFEGSGPARSATGPVPGRASAAPRSAVPSQPIPSRPMASRTEREPDRAAPASAPVEVRLRTWDEYGTLAPQLKRGSLFVETTAPRAVAEEVRVRIVAPDGRAVELVAEVALVVSRERAAASGKPAGMGVRFTELGNAEQHALAELEQAYRSGGASSPPSRPSASEEAPSFDRRRSPTAPDPSARPPAADADRRARTITAPGAPSRISAPPVTTPSPAVDQRRVPTVPADDALRAAAAIASAPPRTDRRAPTAPSPSSAPPSSERGSSAPPTVDAPRASAQGGGRTKSELLADHLAELRRADPFNALGVSVDVGPEDLRAAFVGLAKKWHPNKFAMDGPEVRGLATEIFIVLKKARDTLADPKKLAALRARYEPGPGGGAARRP